MLDLGRLRNFVAVEMVMSYIFVDPDFSVLSRSRSSSSVGKIDSRDAPFEVLYGTSFSVHLPWAMKFQL